MASRLEQQELEHKEEKRQLQERERQVRDAKEDQNRLPRLQRTFREGNAHNLGSVMGLLHGVPADLAAWLAPAYQRPRSPVAPRRRREQAAGPREQSARSRTPRRSGRAAR